MRRVVWLLVLIEGLVMQARANAASEIASARVVIVPAINISEESQIDFGRLNNVDGTCFMDASGALSGTAGMGCNGSESPGLFSVSGLTGAAVNLAVVQGSQGGVTFNPAIAGSRNVTLDGGSTSVTVIGSIELDAANDGIKDISYTFTANYE